MIDLELVQVREEYQQRSTYSAFMNDYLIFRDKYLDGRPITLENLDIIMPDTIRGLKLKLAHRVSNPSLN